GTGHPGPARSTGARRQTTVVQYYAHPRTGHWRHEMIRLGEHAHGVWLGATRGTIVQRGDEEPVSLTRAFVQLIAPDRWWSAIFNHDHAIEGYVDVTTVAEWVSAGRVEMVDLDLDVIRRQGGTVCVGAE